MRRRLELSASLLLLLEVFFDKLCLLMRTLFHRKLLSDISRFVWIITPLRLRLAGGPEQFDQVPPLTDVF